MGHSICLLLLAMILADCMPWKVGPSMLRNVLRGRGNGTGNLVNETDDVTNALQKRYSRIALVYKDNNNEHKYIYSAISFFMVKFMTEYPNDNQTYSVVFDRVLDSMKQFENYTSLEFATPVRRHLDIYKTVLTTPMALVHKHCQFEDDGKECDNKYFAASLLESIQCHTIFQHDAIFAQVRDYVQRYEKPHENVLKTVVDQVKSQQDVSLFDAVIKSINLNKDALEEQLKMKAELQALVAYFQRKNKLKCFEIGRDPE